MILLSKLVLHLAASVSLFLFPIHGLGKSNTDCSNAFCFYLPTLSLSPSLVITLSKLSSTSFPTRAVIVGELVNTSNRTIVNAQVRARFYGRSNELLGTMTNTTYISATLPHQLNLFSISTENILDNAEFDRFETDIASWQSVTTSIYANATVVTTTQYLNYEPIAPLSVTSQLRNDNAVNLHNIRLHIWSVSFAGPGYSLSFVDNITASEALTVSVRMRGVVTNDLRVVAQGILSP